MVAAGHVPHLRRIAPPQPERTVNATGELAREAGDLLDMWKRRVTEGKPVPPVRRAIAAPAAEQGPTRDPAAAGQVQPQQVERDGVT